MTTALQTANGNGTAAVAVVDDLDKSVFESLALKGDISGLKPEDKVRYMTRLCESLGLNPYTQPFLPLKLSGKEVLYASKGCTDQLSQVHNITRDLIQSQQVGDVYVVTCKATGPNGRFEISTGAVSIKGLSGDNLANALMKAETKAKRRATLSFCGLGFLDESELETIPANRIERQEAPAQPALPAAEVEPNDTDDAETAGFKERIAEYCKTLNDAGDSIKWSRAQLVSYAQELFDDQHIRDTDLLDKGKLQFLAEDLGERLRLLKDNS